MEKNIRNNLLNIVMPIADYNKILLQFISAGILRIKKNARQVKSNGKTTEEMLLLIYALRGN